LLGKIVSIDLGSNSVKVIKIHKGFKSFKILQLEEERMPSCSTDDEYLSELNNVLRILDNKVDFKDSKIILSMPSDRVLIRNFVFPFNDISKISEVISFEAEENIPYSLDSISMDFQSVPDNSEDSRTVLFAAAKKDFVHAIVSIFNDMGYSPVFFGMESNSILACYNNLCPELNDTLLFVDIGHNKTVINISNKGKLISTRSIQTGIGAVCQEISNTLKISNDESMKIITDAGIDVSNFESNLESTYYNNDNITKRDLKKIFNIFSEKMQSILSEINLTIKANSIESVSKIILSGGGTNIRGIDRISNEFLGIATMYMPFPDTGEIYGNLIGYTVSYGTVIDYLYNKKNNINFIKGEFTSDISGKNLKIYYLPGFFVILSILIFLINMGFSYYTDSLSSKEYGKIIEKRYKRYFKTKNIPENPVKKARELLQKEEKELKVLTDLVGEREKFIETLGLITSNIPKESSVLELQKINFNEKSIAINGNTDSVKNLESWKRNLISTKKFETVTLETKNISSNIIKFTILIKKEL